MSETIDDIEEISDVDTPEVQVSQVVSETPSLGFGQGDNGLETEEGEMMVLAQSSLKAEIVEASHESLLVHPREGSGLEIREEQPEPEQGVAEKVVDLKNPPKPKVEAGSLDNEDPLSGAMSLALSMEMPKGTLIPLILVIVHGMRAVAPGRVKGRVVDNGGMLVADQSAAGVSLELWGGDIARKLPAVRRGAVLALSGAVVWPLRDGRMGLCIKSWSSQHVSSGPLGGKTVSVLGQNCKWRAVVALRAFYHTNARHLGVVGARSRPEQPDLTPLGHLKEGSVVNVLVGVVSEGSGGFHIVDLSGRGWVSLVSVDMASPASIMTQSRFQGRAAYYGPTGMSSAVLAPLKQVVVPGSYVELRRVRVAKRSGGGLVLVPTHASQATSHPVASAPEEIVYMISKPTAVASRKKESVESVVGTLVDVRWLKERNESAAWVTLQDDAGGKVALFLPHGLKDGRCVQKHRRVGWKIAKRQRGMWVVQNG